MKNLTQNITKTLRSITSLALAMMIALGSAFASSPSDGESKGKKRLSAEDSVMVEELMADIHFEEELNVLASSEIVESFKVYNSHDDVVFSGTQKQWDNQKNKSLVMLKRKAEFLFSSNGENIYKVF